MVVHLKHVCENNGYVYIFIAFHCPLVVIVFSGIAFYSTPQSSSRTLGNGLTQLAYAVKFIVICISVYCTRKKTRRDTYAIE